MLTHNPQKAISFTKKYYIPLMKAFLSEDISDSYYEKKIVEVAHLDQYYLDDDHTSLINDIVGDAQAYWSVEPSAGELDQQELRGNCQKYLIQLEKIVADYENEQPK